MRERRCCAVNSRADSSSIWRILATYLSEVVTIPQTVSNRAPKYWKGCIGSSCHFSRFRTKPVQEVQFSSGSIRAILSAPSKCLCLCLARTNHPNTWLYKNPVFLGERLQPLPTWRRTGLHWQRTVEHWISISGCQCLPVTVVTWLGGCWHEKTIFQIYTHRPHIIEYSRHYCCQVVHFEFWMDDVLV